LDFCGVWVYQTGFQPCFNMYGSMLVIVCADRGRQFIWDHVRMEDVSCYWRKLLVRYAALLRWKPVRVKAYQQIKPRHDEL